METILIVGSGASGVHFAESLLEKGYRVVMLDVGKKKAAPVNPEDTLDELKINLEDPADYFLGTRYEAIVYPGASSAYYTKYYGFPPSKSDIFFTPDQFKYKSKGFQPLFSFAQGGLAEAWTAGVYPLNEAELADFPFGYQEMKVGYDIAAKRIGVNAGNDDLVRFFPYHDNLIEPLRLDEHSQRLVTAYEKNKPYFNQRLKAYLGRSRVGTMSQDTEDRKGCSYCGRCLWGCPSESLYTPSITLRKCKQHPNFEYVTGMLVKYFNYDENGRITSIVALNVDDMTLQEFTADKYALAAGALPSSRIFLESIYRKTGETAKLTGLMDNRQILVPFINLGMVGKAYDPDNYQYHQLAVGLEMERPEEYVHGQITTLKSALVHPIIQNMPLDLRLATFMFRNLRASLGIVNLNLYDRRRDDSYVTIENGNSEDLELVINYNPTAEEPTVIKNSLRRLRSMLWRMGCIVPPTMVHVRPMGASVHYVGVIPMSETKKPLTTDKNCKSHDFDNLYIVDGTTFPFLPAKNITFSLMANAIRVAEYAF